ncbi:hypothetical protein J437_LFUL008547 [Ladona fulva]|uniref:Transposase n=1 Tax=Ladona fulva TaxID=123851 RepID=A0A8K0K8T7_LADFU|nr:hypothetical protein J437_LFUL008547 [Ladona fulva]
MLQKLKPFNKVKRLDFCSKVLEQMAVNNTFLDRLVFSDEATFHLLGQVNRHNIRIRGNENPHESVEHERDSPKVNVFAALSREKLYGPFFFIESTSWEKVQDIRRKLSD